MLTIVFFLPWFYQKKWILGGCFPEKGFQEFLIEMPSATFHVVSAKNQAMY
jgi:hypothetical protein